MLSLSYSLHYFLFLFSPSPQIRVSARSCTALFFLSWTPLHTLMLHFHLALPCCNLKNSERTLPTNKHRFSSRKHKLPTCFPLLCIFLFLLKHTRKTSKLSLHSFLTSQHVSFFPSPAHLFCVIFLLKLSGFLERLSVLSPPSGDMVALVSITDTADSVTLSMLLITSLCPGNRRTKPTVEMMPPGSDHVAFFNGVIVLH